MGLDFNVYIERGYYNTIKDFTKALQGSLSSKPFKHFSFNNQLII